jgi:hypothetical protein
VQKNVVETAPAVAMSAAAVVPPVPVIVDTKNDTKNTTTLTENTQQLPQYQQLYHQCCQ